MKKLAILLICIAFLSSCHHKKHSFSSEWQYDGDIHYKVCDTENCNSTAGAAKHSFGEERDEGNGFAVLQCTVCGSEQRRSIEQGHVHTFGEGFTSDSNYHWQTCTECNSAEGKEEHIWSDGTVTVPPTSEAQGEAERYCSVCGKFSVITLAPLPEKIDEDEWRELFALENVRISEKSKSGSVSSNEATHEIDGALIRTTDNTGASVYMSRRALSTIDFSDYYAYFSNYGDGVYKASEFYITVDNANQRIQNVAVTIVDDKLSSITYSVKLGGFGTIVSYFTFYDFGAVSLSPTYLDGQLLKSALDNNHFNSDLTLNYQRNDITAKYTSAELTVSDGRYVYKTYENGNLKSVKNGSSASASEKLAKHLESILTILGANNFVYEEFYKDYTYVGDEVEISDVGIVVSCDIIIKDGRLSSLSLSLSNGTQIFYEFEYGQ